MKPKPNQNNVKPLTTKNSFPMKKRERKLDAQLHYKCTHECKGCCRNVEEEILREKKLWAKRWAVGFNHIGEEWRIFHVKVCKDIEAWIVVWILSKWVFLKMSASWISRIRLCSRGGQPHQPGQQCLAVWSTFWKQKKINKDF